MTLRPEDTLPPAADLLELSDQGLTPLQIADRFGFHIDSVRKALKRARERRRPKDPAKALGPRPTLSVLLGDAPALSEDTPCYDRAEVWGGVVAEGQIVNPEALVEALRGCARCPLAQWRICDAWARGEQDSEYVAAGQLFISGRPRTEATRRALRAAVGEHAAAHVMSKATHVEETS